MATLEQLESEVWWGREITTSPMVGLGLQLRTAYGTNAFSVGIKGDEVHLSGGHRSQEWIDNSRYCTNRTYTVQSGLAGDQLRYCSALDFTPGAWGTVDNRSKMQVLTARMITAMKAGRCDEVLEVFGTLDGRTVTGWRNDLNREATSDSSHLDHIHIRFNRKYCNDNAVMSKVAEILLEEDMALDASDANVVWYTKNLPSGTPTMTPATALLSAQQGAQAAKDSAAKAATGTEEIIADLSAMKATLDQILSLLQSGGGGGGGTFPPSSTFGATGTITWNPSA